MRTVFKASLLCFCGIVVFLSCSNLPNRPDAPESAEYCVYLAGKVLKQDGTPLSHTSVTIGGLPCFDSTDSNGDYLVKLPKGDVSTTFAGRLASGAYIDTLSFIADGQTFKKLTISDWIDTLPDVIVAEINVSGNFDANAPAGLMIEALIAVQDSQVVPDDRTIGLAYIPATRGFAGIVYLASETGETFYTLTLNVYGPDSLLTGRSEAIVFSSQTAEVDVPFFNPQNAVPVCSAGSAQTTVSLNDTIRLSGSASDAFGEIVTWEWDAGNSGSFVETTPDSGLIVIAPDLPRSTWPCILRVTDDDGVSALDTVLISVVTDRPVPSASAGQTTVSLNDTIRLRGSASDSFGRIVSWEWDAGNSGSFVETTPDSGYIAVASGIPRSGLPCVLRVTDDDGVSTLDTVFINVVTDRPFPSASAAQTTVSLNDTIRLRGTASDSFGRIVSWEWDAGNSGLFVETTPDSGCIAIAPDSARSAWPCVLRVTDDDGNIARDTVFINVLRDPPVPHASGLNTTVTVNEPIELRGTASDGFGRIVTWEWDAGNTGAFLEVTPDSNVTVTAPDTAQSEFPCVLRVTDDDGNSATDTVMISVIPFLIEPPVVQVVSGLAKFR